MSDELIVTPEQRRGEAIAPLPSFELAREFARQSKAENTLKGYRADWIDFCQWCESHRLCPLPANPEAVAAYIAERAQRLKVGSIQRRLNAITEAHKAMALESPTHSPMVRNTIKAYAEVRALRRVRKPQR